MGYPMPIGYLPSKITAQSIAVGGDITMGSGAVIKLDTSTSTSACPLQFNGDPNTGLRYVSADVMGAICGGNGSGQFAAGQFTISIGQFSYLDMGQTTNPASPSANRVYIYAADNGGLCTLYSEHEDGIQTAQSASTT